MCLHLQTAFVCAGSRDSVNKYPRLVHHNYSEHSSALSVRTKVLTSSRHALRNTGHNYKNKNQPTHRLVSLLYAYKPTSLHLENTHINNKNRNAWTSSSPRHMRADMISQKTPVCLDTWTKPINYTRVINKWRMTQHGRVNTETNQA